MNTTNRLRSMSFVVISLSLLPASLVFARPRPPLPPLPERTQLTRWSFDEGWWNFRDPTFAPGLTTDSRVESWSGLALVRDGHPVLPVVFPAITSAGRVCVAGDGALRFWFRPYWGSITAGGLGPGTSARLLDWVSLAGDSANALWSLQASPDGSALALYALGGAGAREILRIGIAWPEGGWHLLVLNYGPRGTQLFIDGQLAAEGAGVLEVPPAFSGLVVGSALSGAEAAGGEFEDICAFGAALTERGAAAHWQSRASLAALGPIMPEEDAARRAAALAVLAQKNQTQSFEGGMEGGYGPLDSGGCVTNGIPWLTNVVCWFTTNESQVISFDIAGGTNNVPYDILVTTNLTTSGSNLVWRWLQQGYTCGSYPFTNQPAAQAFYALGWNVDLDSDGMPDWWEAAHGLDPRVNDAGDDPDDDGRTNLQEYQYQSDPFDNMLIAWGDDASGQGTVPWGFGAVQAMAGGGGSGAGGHTLVITQQTVVAWGANNYGQCDVPSGLSNVVAVAAGGDQSLALKTDGSVVQWGRTYASLPASLTNTVAVSAGYYHSLALKADGTVLAWGRSNCPANLVPDGLAGVKAISAGWNHNLALKSNGTVVVWGLNGANLGWNLTNAPVGLTNIVALAAGALHSVALRSDGTVVAWGSNLGGATDVAAGLSNVTAIAAGRGYTLALLSDSTVTGWGASASAPPEGLTNVTAIAAGPGHGFAIRKGAQKPLILRQPRSVALPAGSSATFQVSVASRQQPSHQWLRTNSPIAGATTATLTLNSVQASDEGGYRVRVTNAAGTVTSHDAEFLLVTPPVLLSPAAPQKPWVMADSNLTLTVSVQAGGTRLDPLRYLWSKDGRLSIPPVSLLSNHIIKACAAGDEAVYAVTITNKAGTTSSPPWTVRVAFPGSAAAWGRNDANQTDRPLGLSEIIAVAGGGKHSLALQENGTVTAWGGNDAGQTNVPTGLTNVLGLAAGTAHSLAVLENGSVSAWGRNDAGQTNAPAGLTNATAVSAGGNQCLALLADGTVAQWGETNGPLPANLAGVCAIASGTNFHLALLTNGTVVAWGGNSHGQTNVPAGLTNAVAIAAGGAHALALREDGSVVGWGDNVSGQANSPIGLTNAMAVAAGGAFSLALRNDGTVAAWGDNAWDQTNMLAGLYRIKRIAAGTDHALAVVFSPTVQYPVEVAKDMLLLYNTTSTNSIWVKDYYLAHRPLVGGANVLGLSCATNERMGTVTFTNQVLTPYLNWLNQHPTKRPQYLLWFYDLPGRVGDAAIPSPSPSYRLHTAAPGLPPFVTCINLRTTNDCKAYIDKLEFFGTNYSYGRLFISASKSQYGNTNFVFDGVRHCPGYGLYEDFSGRVGVVSNGVAGVLAADIAGLQITFQDGIETNGASAFPPHIMEAANLAGYMSWGAHSRLGSQFAINGTVRWLGASQWWIIATVESYNGTRDNSTSGQSNFLEWFSEIGFSGTNYSSTPVGAVTHVEEPGLAGVNDARSYFSLWAKGKCFATAAWSSWPSTMHFPQVVGDPFVTR